MAEHPLHPGEHAAGAIGRGRVAAPEPELAAGGGQHLVGHQPQQHETAGREVVDRPVVAHLRREPALELPANARRQRRRGERAFVAPAPSQPLTPLGLGLDHHPCARETERPESRHESLGQRLGRERGGLDVHGGWIELGGLDELGRRGRG